MKAEKKTVPLLRKGVGACLCRENIWNSSSPPVSHAISTLQDWIRFNHTKALTEDDYTLFPTALLP